MRRYVLVGTGIAALSAAEAVRETDSRARITIVGNEPHPFYSRPGLAYLLTGELPERALYIRTRAELADLRFERLHAVALRADTVEHQLVLADGRTVPYDRLLLAPGAASVSPAFDGATLAGILRLDGLDDARALRALARPRRRAVVIGGGITALEIVEGLASQGVETHYLMRSDRYWARVLDSPEARAVESRLERAGVQLHHRTEIARAVGDDGRITAVETRTGARIACDVLAFAAGVRPRLELAQASGIHARRGIITDEFLRTSAADVFAAGDAAEVRDAGTDTSLLDTLWATAAAHGRAAGCTMAGTLTPYRREPAINVTRLAGLTTTIIGAVEGGGEDEDLVTITRGQSERWRAVADAWALRGDPGENRVRVVLGADRILGAVIMGDQALSHPLRQLIAARADTRELRDALRAQPHALAPLVTAFHARWKVERAAAA